jgi:hypothetical protein
VLAALQMDQCLAGISASVCCEGLVWFVEAIAQ